MLRAAILSLPLLLLNGCGREPSGDSADSSDLFRASASLPPAAGEQDWQAALAPRDFRFPADHAAHDEYRIEWWYYTGNLQAEDGSRFGYQLTFFRTGLHKQPSNPSRWAVRDLYTAHFAVSDIDKRQHYCFQRNNRRGVGQAGAEASRYEVWNGDWRVWLESETHRLQAAESNVQIDLSLSPAKPLVLHGKRGLSKKGPTAGNASYYYSFTRLTTSGTVRIGGQTFSVDGQSWMDHEFSTSFLEPGQVGWDWFAIQLDNDRELMLYRMRRADGSSSRFSSGSLVDADGRVTQLSLADFHMKPLRNWKSPHTRGLYPLHWEIELPELGYRLTVRPTFAAQEMTTSDTTGISYWEGAIEIVGESVDGRVRGHGYMELTGYVGQGLGSLLK